MTQSLRLDEIRGNVLDRMEKAERNVRFAIIAAALAEMVLFAAAFVLVDFSNHLEKLIFIFSMLSYTTIAFGLVALGAHVSRSNLRLLGAIDSAGRSG
ncbi:MAG: hypothetical protein ABJC63_12475 [Gemmatimonadales bacterium]